MPNPPAEAGWARIADLHPTQITVGFREVAQKRLRLRSQMRSACERGAPQLVAPIVLGPAGALYLIDRHHLVCATRDEGVQQVQIRQIADFSALATQDFWPALEARGWCHPYDAEGRRRPFDDIPLSLAALQNDPLRSLASALRRAGGFTKKAAPFSEFAWADFLRRRISSDAVTMHFDDALDRALILSRTAAAQHLPGWVADRAAVPSTRPQVAAANAYR